MAPDGQRPKTSLAATRATIDAVAMPTGGGGGPGRTFFFFASPGGVGASDMASKVLCVAVCVCCGRRTTLPLSSAIDCTLADSFSERPMMT
jgi:hypothetical protein